MKSKYLSPPKKSNRSSNVRYKSNRTSKLSREYIQIEEVPRLPNLQQPSISGKTKKRSNSVTCISGGGGKPMASHIALKKKLVEQFKQQNTSHMTGSIVVQVKYPSTINDAKYKAAQRLVMLKDICSRQGYDLTVTNQTITPLVKIARGNKKYQVLKTNIEMRKI